MIVDPSAISRQSVGDQLGSDRQPTGDRSATVSWAFVFDCRNSATFWRSVGNRSATGRRSVGDYKLCRDCLQPLQLVGDQSATSRRPVGNLSATTKNLSTIDLVAERFHLQQPKPPCDQIVPATFCNRSATSCRPPCNHPATSLRPPEILVARRSPTGCKLCVTGTLTGTTLPLVLGVRQRCSRCRSDPCHSSRTAEYPSWWSFEGFGDLCAEIDSVAENELVAINLNWN